MSPPEGYCFDEFELHPGRRSLTRTGEKIPLAPKAFEVLTCLVVNAGRPVTKDELLKTVWPGAFVEEANLAQHIFALRKALGDRSSFIATLPGRGYQFTAPVQTITLDQPAEPAPLPDAPTHRYTFWATAALIIALCGLIGWGIRHRLNGAVVPGDHHEVVLADFDNSTGDPDLDHSLKTLLAIDLTQSPFLVVASEADTRKILKLMNRPPDSDLPPSVAREVCERLNDQVVLSGLIARFGQKYLVTLTATDCSDGKDLVHTKAVASNREGVIAAVDSASADMRQRLGEPLKSLPSVGQPLAMAHTFSLEALKAYSQGRTFHLQGNFETAIPFFKRAIDLDPSFASAYSSLSNCYSNLSQSALAHDAMAKAYKFRDQAEEPERLRITTLYEYWKTGDRHAAIRNYETWAAMYPRQSYPIMMAGSFQIWVGRLDLAIADEQRAMSLDPNSISTYIYLCESLLDTGRIHEANSTCRQALARGFDTLSIHYFLRSITLLLHDTAGYEEQIAWYRKNTAEDEQDIAQSDFDLSQGKVHASIRNWLRAVDFARQHGDIEPANDSLSGLPRVEADLGMIQDARKHIKAFDPFPVMNIQARADVTVAMAEIGEVATAEKLLNQLLTARPHDSDVLEVYAPQAEAAIALARGDPQAAIAAMLPTHPYEFSTPTIPHMRGRAYLAAKQPELAQREFRNIIDRPFVDTISDNVPRAHLGLARALEMQGNHAAARQEYETLFSLWKDADPNVPLIQQAHIEYAHLK
jgi:DNA-binding winged helix-turn-helix (wHTH) protein/tetratricopeptide (TPR) repeat protein